MKGLRRSEHRSRASRPASRFATLFAALLAIVVQTFIVQTHIHATLPLANASVEQSVSANDGAHATASHDQAQCAICLTLASNGNTTLAAPAAFIDAHNASNALTAVAIRDAPRIVALPWQSRAPPIPL